MGTHLSSILSPKEIDFDELANKAVVVDAYNMLYQFLSTIRQRDGALLKDSRGRITSHLSGLFFRTTKLMKQNIRVAFVFDGKAPDLKAEERERRSARKKEAQEKYEKAKKEEDVELMRKYASRTSRLTAEMVEESQELLSALGLPYITAPSEGEAQAAYMVRKGEFFGLVSQDTDGLLFGSPRIIRNLSITKRRRRGVAYETTNPEIIELSELLNNLGVDREQLIVIAMLCGTDFNIGGVKGIGPKKALSLVKQHGKDFEAVFSEAEWEFDYPWKKVYDVFVNMPVTDDYEIKWGNIDFKRVKRLLVEEHEFSEDRIESSLKNLIKEQAQKGLGEFF